MNRTYDYHGFTLDVAVESGFNWQHKASPTERMGFVAIVRIFQSGATVAVFSPLRFGESGGRPFTTEADALMGGYSAAQKIVDDLFSQQAH